MNKTLLNSTRNVEQKAKNKDASGNLIAEADGNNEITRYYIHGAGLLAMVTPSDQVSCYHFNGTGSTVAMTDAAQSVINQYRYDPFGNIISQSETIPQPFTFVGQYGVMTEPNGFYYMRARYYDPQVGRFISEDPIGFDGGDVNLYAYVGNNPIMGVDPWGRCAKSYSFQNFLSDTSAYSTGIATVLFLAPGTELGSIVFGGIAVGAKGLEISLYSKNKQIDTTGELVKMFTPVKEQFKMITGNVIDAVTIWMKENIYNQRVIKNQTKE